MADATDADAGEITLSAYVFIDTDGDEMMILSGIASATIAASDLIAYMAQVSKVKLWNQEKPDLNWVGLFVRVCFAVRGWFAPWAQIARIKQ